MRLAGARRRKVVAASACKRSQAICGFYGERKFGWRTLARRASGSSWKGQAENDGASITLGVWPPASSALESVASQGARSRLSHRDAIDLGVRQIFGKRTRTGSAGVSPAWMYGRRPPAFCFGGFRPRDPLGDGVVRLGEAFAGLSRFLDLVGAHGRSFASAPARLRHHCQRIVVHPIDLRLTRP